MKRSPVYALIVLAALAFTGCKKENVPVTYIKLNITATTLEVEGMENLTAVAYPANATNRKVQWSSSSPFVVKVDQYGAIDALKVGDATITATAKDGSGHKAQCFVTVIPKSE